MIANNIHMSIIRATRDIINEIVDDELGAPQFVDWDAHADLHELPNFDLIGPAALGFEEDNGMFSINFSIGVSTYNDTNLFRLRSMIAYVFEKLRPQKQLVYYDAEIAQALGYMVITNGTMVAPMSRAEVRPWQFVQATALLEPLAAL